MHKNITVAVALVLVLAAGSSRAQDGTYAPPPPMDPKRKVNEQDCSKQVETDGRGAYASLTEAGLDVEREARSTHREGVRRYFLERLSEEELVEHGFELEFVRRVAKRIASTQFKRVMPIIAKLSHRTINQDFRYLRDWGK